MADNIQNFITSGILEAYVIGSLSECEAQEVQQMKKQYPAVKQALMQIEGDLECLAMQMAVPPPPLVWERIEGEINDLINSQGAAVSDFRKLKEETHTSNKKPDQQYIEVEAQSEYIKVHKWWRPAFIAVFIIGKLFLATAIYFYIENRHNQQEVHELKAKVSQLEQLKH